VDRLSERLTRPPRRQAIRRRKLDVTKLRSDDIQEQLQKRLAEELPPADNSSSSANVEGTWIRTKYFTFKVASEVLGYSTTKHKDWFDDQDAEAPALLDQMHSTHPAWINDKSSSTKKAAYARARSRAQTRRHGTRRINGGKPNLLSCKQLPIIMIIPVDRQRRDT